MSDGFHAFGFGTVVASFSRGMSSWVSRVILWLCHLISCDKTDCSWIWPLVKAQTWFSGPLGSLRAEFVMPPADCKTVIWIFDCGLVSQAFSLAREEN